MNNYLKCPGCEGIIVAPEDQKIVKCETCGKSYYNPYFKEPQVEVQPEVETSAQNVVDTSVAEQTTAQCQDNDVPETQQEVVEESATQQPVAQEEQEQQEEQQAKEQEVPVFMPHNNAPQKKASNGKKYDKKKVLAVVKSAICLALCIILFGFAFCPIIKYSGDIEFAGADYIQFMSASAKNYDPETDIEKIEKLYEELEKFELEAENTDLDESYRIGLNGETTFSPKYKKFQHDYYVLYFKYLLSVKGQVSEYEKAQMSIVGAFSLIYILLASAMIVMSSISLAFSLVKLLNGEKADKLKFWDKFHYLFAAFLFISILILFVILPGGYAINSMTVAMIFRLVFECIALAFVIADVCTEFATDKKQTVNNLFKLGAIALGIVIIGICFVPFFKGTITKETSRFVDGEEVTTEYTITFGDRASLFGSSSMSEEDFNDIWAEKDHEYFVNAFKNALENAADRASDGNVAMYNLVNYAYLDGKTYEESQKPIAGYYMMILGMIAVGAYVCVSLFTSKASFIARKVVLGLAIVFIFAAMICGAVMVKNVNEYASGAEITDFKMSLGGAAIATFLLSAMTFAADFMPMVIEKKKQQTAPEQE